MSDEQNEINEWLASDEFKSGEDPISLLAPERSREYLRNRLWKAFTAGMDAGKRISKKRMAAAICKMCNDAL